jgi:hypothetical protein
MKTRLLRLLSLSCLATLTWLGTPLSAQQEKKTITNADVVQMVKAGLAENVVIAAIQSNPAAFDTSAAALIELNRQGVTAKVQEAMLKAGQPSAPPPANAGVEQAQKAMAAAGALYHAFLIDGDQRTELKQNKGEIDSVAAPFFHKIYTKFEGRQAEFRVASGALTFEVALPGNQVAHEHIKLVKPDVKKDKRELTIQGMAGPGVPIKPDKKAQVAVTFEEIKRDGGPGFQTGVHRIKPSSPLPPGEYVLIVGHQYYCLGVDAKK